MAARQPSTSFADRDGSRSHGSMMTEWDEGTGGPLLARVWDRKRASFPRAVRSQRFLRVAAFRQRLSAGTHAREPDSELRLVQPTHSLQKNSDEIEALSVGAGRADR